MGYTLVIDGTFIVNWDTLNMMFKFIFMIFHDSELDFHNSLLLILYNIVYQYHSIPNTIPYLSHMFINGRNIYTWVGSH